MTPYDEPDDASMKAYPKYIKFHLPEGSKWDIQPIPPDAVKQFAAAMQADFEKKLLQSLSVPQHLLEGSATYSAYRVDYRLDRVLAREQAVCLIWGQLLAAGFKGNVRNLASSIWMAHECFERSLDALARHHRLGDWRFRRLA